VQAAGVNNQKSRNRMGVMLGLGAAVIVMTFFGLWGAGIINISIPGLGNPFAGSKGAEVKEVVLEDSELTEEERKMLESLKGEARRKFRRTLADRRRPAARRPRTGGGGVGDLEYVKDGADGSGGPRGTRGGGAQGVDIDLETGGGIGEADLTEAQLPSANVNDIPLPETGRLDAKMITQIVTANRKAIEICYQRALKGNQQIGGKVEFSVTVQPSGSVDKVKVVSSRFQGTELARCIAKKIENWRFPSFNGDAQKIVIPFHLQSGGSF
jgi:hypothetical protein